MEMNFRKKSLFFTISSLIIIILISLMYVVLIKNVNLIHAQDISGISGVPPELEKIQEIGEKISDEELRKDYLKQEWNKILEKKEFYIKYLKPTGEIYKKVAVYTDPIFKIIIGMAPSLSWLFFLTLVLWIAFVVYMFRIFSLISVFSKGAQNIITIGLIIIFSALGAIKKLAEYIINSISILGDWRIQLAVCLAVIIALAVASIFSKNLEDLFKAIKEKREKKEEETDRRKLKREVETAEEFGREIRK